MYIFVLFAGVALTPAGVLSGETNPLARGIEALIPGLTLTPALGLASIGALVNVTPWLYAFSRQVFALSRKGFLPSVLMRVSRNVPYAALLASSLAGYTLVLLLVVVNDATLNSLIEYVDDLAALILYLWIPFLFIVIRRKSKDWSPTFRSPFGIPGAVFCIVTYLLCFCFLTITSNSYIGYGVAIVVILHLVWMAYYCLVSKNYLVLDADEKHAIISTLTVDRMLHTEHGYDYLEEHCLEEMNPESLYCIKVSS